MLDGNKVEIGDVVYDIILGHCRVVSVSRDGSFAIKSKENTITISEGGFLGKSKRVYWDNPIIIVPRKHDKAYRMATKVAVSVYKDLNQDTWGFMDEAEDEEVAIGS